MNENLRLLRPFLRGLPIIITIVLMAVIIAKKYLNYVTPMYESTTKLKLADIHEGVPSANLFKDLDLFASPNKIAAEIEVIKSSLLVEKTLEDLPFKIEIYRQGRFKTVELYENAPIQINAIIHSAKACDKRYTIKVISNKKFTFWYPNEEHKIEGTFDKPFEIDGAKIIISKNEKLLMIQKGIKLIDSYQFECLSTQKLMDKIYKNLDVIPVDKDVPIIRINLKSNVPEKAAAFVNKLAENYIKDYIETKYRAANTTVDFLNNEIEGANKKLVKSENNIQNYRDDRNIINIPQETETDLRKIAQLKIQQSNIKMNLDAIKDLNRYIELNKGNYLELAPNFEAFTDLLSTEMVKNMKKLQAEKKDLLLVYTPENEKVKVIDNKIKDLVDYQIESIKNTEKNLQIKYSDLTNDINIAQQAFVGLPEKEKTLTKLNREFNLYEKNYNFLNEKRIEAEIAKSAKIAFHKIISPGEIAKTPISPIRSIIIIVAAFLGFFLSTAVIYIVHFSKAKVNDCFTIEKNSSIPIAMITPFFKNTELCKTYFLKEAIQMELKQMIHHESKICITSFDRDSDHYFHSFNLFTAFKNQGRKVLFIDASLNIPDSLNKDEDYLNLSSPEYLKYTFSQLQKLIEEKNQQYELCVIHNQAIKEERLAITLMSLATQNLVILDSRKTAEKTILKIELLREEFQLPNVWFVLNKAHYNPSIFKEVKKIWNTYLKKQTI